MSLTETIALGVLATSGAAVAAADDVWRLTAFLALGASVGVLWSCLSKERVEEGRVTKARIITGIFSGIGLPRVMEVIFDWVRWPIHLSTKDPILIIVMGFLSAVLGFFVTHSILRKVETKQEVISGAIEQTGKKFVEAKLGVTISDAERKKAEHGTTSTDETSRN